MYVSAWIRSLLRAGLAEQHGRGASPGNSTYESSAASAMGSLQARRWLLEFVLPGRNRKVPRDPSLLLHQAAGGGFRREAEKILAKAEKFARSGLRLGQGINWTNLEDH